MTNNVNINTLELRKKLTPQNLINYRVYYIGKDGIQVGGNPISGRFQWGNIHELARGILRAWARDLVEGHDTIQIGAILHRWAKDWAAEDDIAETYTAITKPSPPERLLSWLKDKHLERKAFFRQHNNERDGTVMFNLSEEMIEAVGYCLKKVIIKPQTDGHRFSLYRVMWDRLFREGDVNGK